jgi:hypothetical protein
MTTETPNLVLEQLRDLRRAHDQLLTFITELRGHDLRNAFRALELEALLKKCDARLRRIEEHLDLPDPDSEPRPN